jgi:hypothetical protein
VARHDGAAFRVSVLKPEETQRSRRTRVISGEEMGEDSREKTLFSFDTNMADMLML